MEQFTSALTPRIDRRTALKQAAILLLTAEARLSGSAEPIVAVENCLPVALGPAAEFAKIASSIIPISKSLELAKHVIYPIQIGTLDKFCPNTLTHEIGGNLYQRLREQRLYSGSLNTLLPTIKRAIPAWETIEVSEIPNEVTRSLEPEQSRSQMSTEQLRFDAMGAIHFF